MSNCKTTLIIIFLCIAVFACGKTASVEAATYYLDAEFGSDNSGDGSLASPWASLQKAQQEVVGGDTVYLRGGEYGSYSESDISREEYIVFESFEGEEASLSGLHIYNNSLHNSMLKFIGLRVKPEWRDPCYSGNTGCDDPQYSESNGNTYSKSDHPVSFHGVRDVLIDDCIIEGQSKYLTSVGVLLADSEDIIVRASDISEVERPIQIQYSENILISGNHLHTMTQSAVNVYTYGPKGARIENNYIHGSTVSDSDDYVSRAEHYHGSGVAVHGPNVTISGNIIHGGGFPSGGIMSYEDDSGNIYHNDNLLIENNLLYDLETVYLIRLYKTGDNVVIRNNTLLGHLRESGGGPYRFNTAFNLASWDDDGDPSLKFYNNIVVGIAGLDFPQIEEDNNIIWSYIYGSHDFKCEGEEGIGPNTRILTCSWLEDPREELSSLFPNEPNLDFQVRHGAFLDFTIDENSLAYNMGSVSEQAASSLGQVVSGFIVDTGEQRSDTRHSAGAYEYESNVLEELIRADVNQDSSVNSSDALLILRRALNRSMSGTSWYYSSTTGDVNCDDSVTTVDALLLLREHLGLDNSGNDWCGG